MRTREIIAQQQNAQKPVTSTEKIIQIYYISILVHVNFCNVADKIFEFNSCQYDVEDVCVYM